MFETNAHFLVLPMARYHKRVPIYIDTFITDLVINSLDISDSNMPFNVGNSLLY